MLEVVGGVLHLGGVTFQNDASSGNDGAVITPGDSSAAAAWSAKLLGVSEPGAFQAALVTRTAQMGSRETVKVPLRPEQAIENRDALAKFVYDRLFDWLVETINHSLAPENSQNKTKGHFIGILDIFG